MTDDLEDFTATQNRFVAAVADLFFALKDVKLPDRVAEDITIAWAAANISYEEEEDE